MMHRLSHWLEVLPPVAGANIKLINTEQVKELCTSMDKPTINDTPSQVDSLQSCDPVDTESEVCHDVALAFQCSHNDDSSVMLLPDFPLLPVSRGFQMKMQKLLSQFEQTLTAAGIVASTSPS